MSQLDLIPMTETEKQYPARIGGPGNISAETSGDTTRSASRAGGIGSL